MCVNVNVNPENTEKAVGKVVRNVTGELSKEVGFTLANVWHLVFGSFNHQIAKWRIKQQQALDEFSKDVAAKVLAVPEDKRIDPNLNIIGSALEKAKYAIEEPELRNMFANLIASATNSDMANKVQPSFASIIEQLSPLDAQNLATFRTKATQAIAAYRYSLHPKGYLPILDHVFLGNPNEKDLEIQSLSLSVLEHQGLVEIDYSSWLNNNDVYNAFGETPFYKARKAPFIEKPESIDDTPRKKDFIFQKGLVSLTPLGKSFIHICLPR